MKLNDKNIIWRGFIATTVKKMPSAYLTFSFGSAIATILNEKHSHIGLIYASGHGVKAYMKQSGR